MGTLAPKGDPSSHGGHGRRQPSLPKQRTTGTGLVTSVEWSGTPMAVAMYRDSRLGESHSYVRW